MYVVHSIESYAVWTMKRAEREAKQAQKTDKRKFYYDYALGYFRKVLKEHRDDIRIGKPKKFGVVDPNARYFPADTLAVDLAQDAFLLWHKSRKGRRVRLDTRAACRFAIRNYWRAQRRGMKGEITDAANPNSKYASPTISTARMNNMANVQTVEGIPDKITRNLDMQTIDMEQSDTTITTVVRMLSTGATQRDVANHTDLSEMQVSRIVSRLRDMGAEYWGIRKQGETIPQAPIATIAERAPKNYRPIVVATNGVQTVQDYSPIRKMEQEYSPYWREYAERHRMTNDDTLRDAVEQYGYTQDDMANPVPTDDDFLVRVKIIYS